MTKAELKEYRAIDRELRGLEGAMAALRARMESPTRAAFGHAPSKGGVSDPIADAVARYAELMERYNARWDALIEAQRRIEAAIEGLNPIERTVMRYRYIEGYSEREIAERIHYTPRSIRRIHRRALYKMSPYVLF